MKKSDIMQNKARDIAQKKRELSIQLLLLQEEEHQKLATDIHQNLGQSMTVLAMQLDRLRKLSPEELRPDLDEIEIQKMEVVQQIRDLNNFLSMHMLRNVGLRQALRDFFDKVQNSTSLKINFGCNMPDPKPALIVEISIFRIIQQAITNVLKHANTDEVDITIETTTSTLNLRIADRGTGFVPDTAKLSSTGIMGMRERAEVLGAAFKIQSSPGKGTILTAEFPLSSSTQ